MLPLTVVLAPGSLNHIANIVKGYAIAIGVAFAMWMVWQWWQTRQIEIASERAARAKRAWGRHLALALQNPELAEPMLGSLASSAEAVRYRMFVASLLVTSGEILDLDPSDAWRATLSRHLEAHHSYLASPEFHEGGLADCSREVRALVSRLRGG